ncbi:spidroin-2 [Desulfovibrio sp. SGI.169]|uniref:spidroin-2 n=1 Tax=Desulfovibrio sp. SGI.169 TaxID=3420561 RepID=UPI003D047ABC
MQDISIWTILPLWCGGLLGIGMNAAAALPLIIALTLLIGRRGQARLCAYGAARLAGLTFGLSWLALPGMFAALHSLLSGLSAAGQRMSAISLASPPMLGCSLPLLLWLAGILCAALLRRACVGAPLPPRRRPEEDRHATAAIKGRLLLCALTALCFFSTYVLHNWPFIALPPGMDLGRAAGAVFSNALHKYFMAFTPAGALALLFLLRARRGAAAAGFDENQTALAARWCALWATVGYIPFCLDRWGILLGYLLRGATPDWLLPQLYALIPLTAAVACWGTLLGMGNPLRRSWLMGLGVALLALGESLPFILMLA